MELYKRFPKLCLLWCSIEVTLYAGQIFGWSALMYVLKDEGFYAEYCETFVTPNSISDDTFSIVELPERLSMGNDSKSIYILANADKNRASNSGGVKIIKLENDTSARNATHQYRDTTENMKADRDHSTGFLKYTDMHGQFFLKSCAIQDSRLNLWFSIGVGFSYVMCGFLGPLMRRMGMRFYRLVFLAVYVMGALCIGFATTALPWLLCPGLCCIGIAGMALYATNLQVSCLFIKIQSTITAMLVGLFDVSTVTQQIVKIAYANNIPRKSSFIFLAGLHIAMVGISTCLLLPAVRYELSSSKTKTLTVNKSNNETKEEQEDFIAKDEYKEKPSDLERKASPKLRELMLSSQYMLHLFWMTIMALRFVSFIGFLNSWMTNLFMGNTVKETYYLSVFSYMTMGTVFTAITAGLLHDSQRWKYASECDYRRTHLPIILPLIVTILFSVLCTVLSFVRLEGFLYVTFILFTFFRSYVYSYEVTFINDAFPLIHFTQLFGILQLFAGVGSLLQYGLFEWFQAYEIAPIHVNIVLIVLEISTLAHPINIWYRSRRHRCTQDTFISKQSTDIEIQSQCKFAHIWS